MLFLGTGAAELYPNPYCNCEFCESLRQSGEAPRKRSSLLLDAHTLVDLGPDALAAAQMYNARLYDVDHLFLTHSHEDHLCITNLEVLTMTPQRNEKPLHVYLSEPAHVFLTRYMQALRGVYAQGETGLETLVKRGVIELHSFPSYVPVRVGGMELTTGIENLYISPRKKETPKEKSVHIRKNIPGSAAPFEINLLGKTVSEGIAETEALIDRAVVAGIKELKIIHGFGTGRLRAGIWNYLKTNRNVSEFRGGRYGEGEMGVTIVTLK